MSDFTQTCSRLFVLGCWHFSVDIQARSSALRFGWSQAAKQRSNKIRAKSKHQSVEFRPESVVAAFPHVLHSGVRNGMRSRSAALRHRACAAWRQVLRCTLDCTFSNVFCPLFFNDTSLLELLKEVGVLAKLDVSGEVIAPCQGIPSPS